MPRSPVNIQFIQLPVPQLNFGHQAANVPLAGACLAQALTQANKAAVSVLSESLATYLGDAALLEFVSSQSPKAVGFTVYAWNLDRSIFFAQQLKASLNPVIIFGGPEITPDNPRLKGLPVDFLVCGEGEQALKDLVAGGLKWPSGWIKAPASADFSHSPSPYLELDLEPGIENIVLVETQRSCPYGCRYCYYGKSRRKVVFKDLALVIKAADWALEHEIKELYLLDPSLNTRPDLKDLLSALARLNSNGRLKLISEIRAEAVDLKTARMMSDAGFHWVEVGLQSTNPRALETMGRKVDLNKFLAGIENLKNCGITPAVDLILGLPGDDPAGFQNSIEFVAANKMSDDIQVFPLSVLPGTAFRKHRQKLGLIFDHHPPYIVRQTPGFTTEDILAALDQAESKLDVAFYPLPDLDLSWRTRPLDKPGLAGDLEVSLDGKSYIYKLALARNIRMKNLEATAKRLTHPYQLLVTPDLNIKDLFQAVNLLTTTNPFTPFELIFFQPPYFPPVPDLLQACRLHRPHFLDNDLRFLYDSPGNRAVLFTLVSTCKDRVFQGPMQRQVFWWKATGLPESSDLESLADLDGILIDNKVGADQTSRWQDRWHRHISDLPDISFADCSFQRRWLELTAADDYWLNIFDGLKQKA